MTVDIKCPYCKKETDYDLNYDEGFCEHCEKDITYKEMYLCKTNKEIEEWEEAKRIKDKNDIIEYNKKDCLFVNNIIINNRPYEKYKKHLHKLVLFGSLTEYMEDKYLINFMDKEHTEAIVYNMGYDKIKELFPNINKEDFDDIMIGYLMVADLGVKIGKKVQNSMKNVIDEDVEDNIRIDAEFIDGREEK